jgi:uncharacterized protein YgbK (DUF1537 family)
MNSAILGCIADDLTGATDLANNLVRAGMRVVLTIDTPTQEDLLDVDAIVVALKSRTIQVDDAVMQSLKACRWLCRQGARQIYFKICSTFDSTPRGNIGPVIEALMTELDCNFSCVVPAFPDNDRTVYRGYLFVGDGLLSESGMRNHPLTPMTDASLVRYLQLQLHSAEHRRTGLIDYRIVAQSADAIRVRMDELRAEGVSIAIADTICNNDLQRLAAALYDAPLVTAGSGLGMTLPAAWGFDPSFAAGILPSANGRRAIISGSCSVATNAQVRHFIEGGGAALALDATKLVDDGMDHVDLILAWADVQWKNDPDRLLLVYSTAGPAQVKATHDALGVERSGELVERALGAIARAWVERGAGQLVVAGGETAGVCVRALGVNQMRIGPQIDPGVPWCYASSPISPQGNIHIALKSGNFGTVDFFSRAFELLS